MPSISESKKALDKVFRKSRVHFYKPIQIAEILRHHRTEKGWKLLAVESYRNISKRWRDVVSMRLIGRVCTSSQRYQDDVFNANAMPPRLLAKLGEINKAGGGFVEAYVYLSIKNKLAVVRQIEEHIKKATPDNFSIKKLITLFTRSAGLKRSIDKVYEISVYALFAAVVRSLHAQVTIEMQNKDEEILRDFELFIKMVIGMNARMTKVMFPARLYRMGATNAADSGLDMWANFGAAVQVKHMTLTPELAEGIAENIGSADRIVIVCKDADKRTIEIILKQVGWGDRIQGIITLSDLDDWYALCLSEKYRDRLGRNLLKDLEREFTAEFPSNEELVPFLRESGYDKIKMPNGWEIENDGHSVKTKTR